MEHANQRQELPPNYEKLKTAAGLTSNWRERLEAVEELGKWKHEKTIDVLTHRMKNDTVYQVQEAAFRKLRDFGEQVQMPARKKGELVKGFSKILVRIKKSLPEGHTFEEFKDKLKKMRIDVYDTYEGDKGEDFEKWLESTWASLPAKS